MAPAPIRTGLNPGVSPPSRDDEGALDQGRGSPARHDASAFYSTAFRPGMPDRLPDAPARPVVATDRDPWAGVSHVLSQRLCGLRAVLTALGNLSPNPPPMSPDTAQALAARLPGLLDYQCETWRHQAFSNNPCQPDPSNTLGRLAGALRYLGHASGGDVVTVLHALGATLESLHHSGRVLSGQSLSELGIGLARLRGAAHDPAQRDAASSVLGAMAPHLDATKELDDRRLSGLLAGLTHQTSPHAVQPYLDALADRFDSAPSDVTCGSLFIKTGLRGVADLDACPVVDRILEAITRRLPKPLPVELEGFPSGQAQSYFLAGAVLDLGHHLEGSVARQLACELVARVPADFAPPRERFANPSYNNEWLCGLLNVSTAANKQSVDLHGMNHRMAGFYLKQVMHHALTCMTGSTALTVIFGASSHQRSNEGVMRSVAEGVIDNMRLTMGERVGRPEISDARLSVRVKGRSVSQHAISGASSGASTPTSRSTNSFDLLREEAGEASSPSEAAVSKKPRRRSRLAKQSAPVIEIQAKASTSPSPREWVPAPPADAATAGSNGWMAWVKSWFVKS